MALPQDASGTPESICERGLKVRSPPKPIPSPHEGSFCYRCVGGGGLVGVVRVGCEIYTADTVQQLRAIVERLERDAETKK